MKILAINNINFKNTIKTFQSDRNTIEEEYNDYDIIIKRLIKDEFNRDIDSIRFDENGNIIEHLHKEYFDNKHEYGVIETFKNQSQEYIRKAYTRIENSLKHSIDDFKSKSGKSYINDFVYDITGKLIRIINNGKIIEL